MSLVPVTPSFTQNIQNYTPKSFWKRPEGPFGMVVLVAIIVGAGVGLYVILPFLITLLTNTLYAGALAAVLIAVLWCVQSHLSRGGQEPVSKHGAVVRRVGGGDRSDRYSAQ